MRVRTIGFQGENEKKFPEVAAVFKRHERRGQEADRRGQEAARRRIQEARSGGENGQSRGRPPHPRAGEAGEGEGASRPTRSASSARTWRSIRQRWPSSRRSRSGCAELDRESKLLPEAARRVMHSEVRLLDPGTAFASVTSPHRHADFQATSAAGSSGGRRGPEGPGPAPAGDGLDAPAGQSVLRPGHRQPRLGPLLRPGHHRSAGQSVVVQPGLASRIAAASCATASSRTNST